MSTVSRTNPQDMQTSSASVLSDCSDVIADEALIQLVDHIRDLVSIAPVGTQQSIGRVVFRRTNSLEVTQSQILRELGRLRRRLKRSLDHQPGHADGRNADSDGDEVVGDDGDLNEQSQELHALKAEIATVKQESEAWLEDAERRIDQANDAKYRAEQAAAACRKQLKLVQSHLLDAQRGAREMTVKCTGLEKQLALVRDDFTTQKHFHEDQARDWTARVASLEHAQAQAARQATKDAISAAKRHQEALDSQKSQQDREMLELSTAREEAENALRGELDAAQNALLEHQAATKATVDKIKEEGEELLRHATASMAREHEDELKRVLIEKDRTVDELLTVHEKASTGFRDQVKALRDAHEQDRLVLVDGHNNATANLSEAHKSELERRQQHYNALLETSSTKLDETLVRMQEMQTKHDDAMRKLADDHEAALGALSENHREAVDVLKRNHHDELAAQRGEFQQAHDDLLEQLASVSKTHEQVLAVQHAEQRAAQEKLRSDLVHEKEQALALLGKSHADEFQARAKQYEISLEEMQCQHQLSLQSRDKQIVDEQASHEASRSSDDEEFQSIRRALQSELHLTRQHLFEAQSALIAQSEAHEEALQSAKRQSTQAMSETVTRLKIQHDDEATALRNQHQTLSRQLDTEKLTLEELKSALAKVEDQKTEQAQFHVKQLDSVAEKHEKELSHILQKSELKQEQLRQDIQLQMQDLEKKYTLRISEIESKARQATAIKDEQHHGEVELLRTKMDSEQKAMQERVRETMNEHQKLAHDSDRLVKEIAAIREQSKLDRDQSQKQETELRQQLSILRVGSDEIPQPLVRSDRPNLPLSGVTAPPTAGGRSFEQYLSQAKSELSDLGSVISQNEMAFAAKIAQHVSDLQAAKDHLAREYQQKVDALVNGQKVKQEPLANQTNDLGWADQLSMALLLPSVTTRARGDETPEQEPRIALVHAAESPDFTKNSEPERIPSLGDFDILSARLEIDPASFEQELSRVREHDSQAHFHDPWDLASYGPLPIPTSGGSEYQVTENGIVSHTRGKCGHGRHDSVVTVLPLSARQRHARQASRHPTATTGLARESSQAQSKQISLSSGPSADEYAELPTTQDIIPPSREEATLCSRYTEGMSASKTAHEGRAHPFDYTSDRPGLGGLHGYETRTAEPLGRRHTRRAAGSVA